MNGRTKAAPLGKEAVMAEETPKRGKDWSETGRTTPTPQTKPYSASMRDADKTKTEIEKAAYYRWLNRGRPTGDDWTDWLLAEREMKTRK